MCFSEVIIGENVPVPEVKTCTKENVRSIVGISAIEGVGFSDF